MHLSFYSPAYLWGLFFVAVPIAVHLFNRKRTVDLAFSSTRFFRDAAVNANRARNLRRLLQLLLRIAAVVAVATLFAQPYDAASSFNVLANPQARLYCWSDRTVSMLYSEKSGTGAERGASLLDSLASTVPPTARINSYDEAGDAFTDLGRHRAPPAARFGPSRSENVGAALSRALSDDPGPAAFLVFTDTHTPTTDRIDRWLAAGAPPCPVLIVSLKPASPWNFGLRASGIAAETPGVVHATAYRSGRKTDFPGVYVQCGSLRVGHASVDAAVADTARCSIVIPPDATVDRGLVTFDAPDPFSIDNVSYFVKPPPRRGRILIVGDVTPSYPLYAALAALNHNGPASVVVKPVGEVTREQLDGALVVVLNDLVTSSESLDGFLEASAQRQTAVLFAPSTAPEAMITNRRLLRRFGGSIQIGIDSTTAPHTIALPDTISSLWQGFPRIVDLDTRIYRWIKGLPGEPLLRLDNGVPYAVSATDAGTNRWIVFAGPLGSGESNNLCETGFFVPLIDRFVRHAVAGVSAEGGTWTAGAPRTNPYYARHRRADIYNADGAPVATWSGQSMVQFDRPGLYRVQPFGEASYWLAVNADPAETDLRYRRPSVPASWAGQVRVIDAADFVSFVKSYGGRSTLWLWLALGLFLLAEAGLWRREQGARRRAKGAPTGAKR